VAAGILLSAASEADATIQWQAFSGPGAIRWNPALGTPPSTQTSASVLVGPLGTTQNFGSVGIYGLSVAGPGITAFNSILALGSANLNPLVTFTNSFVKGLGPGAPIQGTVSTFETFTSTNRMIAKINLNVATSSSLGNFLPVTSNSNVTGFIGLEMQNGLDTHYAWAKISVSYAANRLNEVAILETAINDIPGEVIHAGQTSAIPEPSTVATGLGLLALGAAGLRERRKRKKPVVA